VCWVFGRRSAYGPRNVSPYDDAERRRDGDAVSGNATFRYSNTCVLSVSAVAAPLIVSSASFDDRLAETLQRVRLRPGMLESLAGIVERRWWPEDVSFIDAAVLGGAKALADSGIDPERIGLLIDSSVSKAMLEPSAAVSVHHRLGLAPACVNFDLSNACLGFTNAMHVAGLMIDAGQIEYALIVDAEGARLTQQRTLARLERPETTSADVMAEFATLTLGSGAAGMVLARADAHPEGHRLVGGVTRAATEHHELCVGDLESMRTDTRGLLDAGIKLAASAWDEARIAFEWESMDRYIIHQVSQVHTEALCATLGIEPDQVPRTFPLHGNIGPASVPFTLAGQVDSLNPGDRVLCMGIGSGLNTSFTEIAW
jgi:3-oxoacyl-[acyl-carrier-protein] synthase III